MGVRSTRAAGGSSCREGMGTAVKRGAREQAGRGEETARMALPAGTGGHRGAGEWVCNRTFARVPLQERALIEETQRNRVA